MEENGNKRTNALTKILIWCLPSLALVLIGIFGFGIMISGRSMFTLVTLVLIGLIFTRIIFLLISNRKPSLKIGIMSAWIFILAIAGLVLLMMPRQMHTCTKTDAVGKFEAEAASCYPESFTVPMDIGDPESVEYHTFKISMVIFESNSYTLLCRYDEAGYEAAVAALEEGYSFRTEPMGTGTRDEDDQPVTINPYVSIGDDHFRVLYPDNGEGDFFKLCLIVATNDADHEIAYILFRDADLDLADDLPAFINEYCGWQYISE